MANYLGLDLGTSSLKALLIDGEQNVLGSATAPLSVERPDFGWSEQEPASWIAAAETVLDALRASHGDALAAVAGIGLSGQMHGATLLDDEDRVIRPCILWNDTRSHLEASELDDEEARAITGNIVFPGFTAPKLEWVRRHEPEAFARTAMVLLPKDYLRLWLTGEHISEMSDAAGTAWLDTKARDWSDAMLARTGLSRAHMPRLVEGTQPGGVLRPELTTRWGLSSNVVVAGGAGDNAASACGVGAVQPGTGFVSLGTSGVLFTASAAYEPAPETALHTFCHALPGVWHRMGVTLSAAGSLEWLSKIAGESPGALVSALAPQSASEPGRLLFLPYLSGERTPHNDASIRGAFIGLEAGNSRSDMTRAVLEGVAYSMRDCLDAGGRAEVPRLIAVGAGARSDHWLQLLANVLGVEIARPAAGDFGAAFGAARLGLVAATGADAASVMSEPPLARTFEPDAAATVRFAEGHRRYRAAYPALAGLG